MIRRPDELSFPLEALSYIPPTPACCQGQYDSLERRRWDRRVRATLVIRFPPAVEPIVVNETVREKVFA